METFSRRPIPWGYVYAKELFEPGQQITIRTINGDEEVSVDEDTILTIAPKGEVYMSSEAEFKRRYRFYPDWSYHLREAEYRPTIKLQKERRVISPMKSAHVCVPKGSYQIQARQLDHKVKLFRDEAEDTYLLGREGDYLVEISEEPSQFTVMERELFEKTYHRASVEPEAQTAVVFDLDGTLIDSSEGITKSTQYALAHYGIEENDLSKFYKFIGPPLSASFQKYYGFSEEKAYEAVTVYRERYNRIGLFECSLYPGVRECIETLKAKGYLIGMASSKPEDSCRRILDHFGILELFDDVVGATFDGRIDTKEEVLNEVLRRWCDVPKNEMCLIGDTMFDVEGANKVGIRSVAVTFGFGNVDEMVAAGAVAVCDDMAKLPEIIESL